MKARPERDEEDTDDSNPVLLIKEARELFVRGKKFLQQNQSKASLQIYLSPIQVEGLVRALEVMTFSARSRQTEIGLFFRPLPAPYSVKLEVLVPFRVRLPVSHFSEIMIFSEHFHPDSDGLFD
jgi:hypothetical protein